MPLKELKYKQNQTILSVYGYDDNKKIKVTTLKNLRTSGVEDEKDKRNTDNRCLVNDCKLSENISRAKRNIFELAYCNPWDYFFTGTIDPKKYDRENLSLFYKDFTQYIRDLRKKFKTDIKYLLIPELHKDGKSWHIHGLLFGLPSSLLVQFRIGDNMGKSLAEKVKNGDIVFNWLGYTKKFGFCDLEPIKNHEAVAKYITKYITKDLAKSVTKLNSHLYYASKGLNRRIDIKKGTMCCDDIVPDFTNEYCSISWLPYTTENIEKILNSFI